jgi:predicted O-methyltransferase YrrM
MEDLMIDYLCSSMNDDEIFSWPARLHSIRVDTEAIGFTLASEPRTGALLRGLAASKPGGRFLELGTGTGVGAAWLLDGMDAASRLVSVDSDASVQEVAKRHLAHDPRVTFYLGDGGAFLKNASNARFDLIYADAWAGKFTHLDLALGLLKIGGIYFIDDLLPQPNWPEGHAANVLPLIADLESRPGFITTRLGWASGLMMLVRTGPEKQHQHQRWKMASAKQKAAARKNIGKAAKAAKRKRTIASLPKKTRTALGKEGAKAARRKR